MTEKSNEDSLSIETDDVTHTLTTSQWIFRSLIAGTFEARLCQVGGDIIDCAFADEPDCSGKSWVWVRGRHFSIECATLSSPISSFAYRLRTVCCQESLYLQSESPGADKEANWLPAPKGPFLPMLRRLSCSPSTNSTTPISTEASLKAPISSPEAYEGRCKR
jgi:hypothetical protein